MEASDEIPDAFFCPITQEVMVDPVIDNDGNSYERSAIETWLQQHSTSPVTRKPLTTRDLRPNRALRDSIEAMKAKGRDLSIKRQVLPAGSAPVAFKQPSAGEIEVKLAAHGSHTLVSLVPPAGRIRTPTDLVVVIDISGSMDADASIKDAQGRTESQGLTVLDIVKHAVKTIITSLEDKDRLAIVSFSDQARVDFDLRAMNAQGRQAALSAVEALHTEGSTNLWDGLHTGLEVLREHASKGKNAAVLLLTDGEPNIVPPRGHVPMLNNYRRNNDGLPGIVMTFGFGYRLDSQLLHQLAVAGDGTYSFIPDSSLTGTVFIHALTKLLTTCATQLVLQIEGQQGAQVQSVPGGHTIKQDGALTEFRFGSISFGQSIDLLLATDLPSMGLDYFKATLTYRDVVTGENVSKVVSSCDWGAAYADAIEGHRLRLTFVDLLRNIVEMVRKNDNNIGEARKLVSALEAEFKGSSVFRQDPIKDLYTDLSGQVAEALSKLEYYEKWGKHYLPSLMGAHLAQSCNNFKDPGVQHYAGQLFRTIRDKIDDTFLKLPPPKPSKPQARNPPTSPHSSARGHAAPSPSSARVSMLGYMNSAGPCFAGSALVSLSDGSTARCDALKKGDLVATPHGPTTVRCVLETAARTGQYQLCALPGGLLVTPWHPIRVAGEWRFPQELVESQSRPCPSVFSFLLEEHHVMIINGVECIALAHGFTDNKVVAHPYYGTTRVTADLSRMAGWEVGHVRLLEGCAERDPETGLVIRLTQHAESA